MKYFIDAVTKQVIERHLVQQLPDIVLSPMVVTRLTDSEVQFIAAEPPEVTQKRLFLESRRELLEKGMGAFREAMSGLKFADFLHTHFFE